MLISTHDQKNIIFPAIMTISRCGNLKHANTSVHGNGNDTNAAVVHTKPYKSMRDYLELTVVNQYEVVILPSVRDLYIKGLKRNGSPNPNSMDYKLLACLWDDPKSLWD